MSARKPKSKAARTLAQLDPEETSEMLSCILASLEDAQESTKAAIQLLKFGLGVKSDTPESPAPKARVNSTGGVG